MGWRWADALDFVPRVIVFGRKYKALLAEFLLEPWQPYQRWKKMLPLPKTAADVRFRYQAFQYDIVPLLVVRRVTIQIFDVSIQRNPAAPKEGVVIASSLLRTYSYTVTILPYSQAC